MDSLYVCTFDKVSYTAVIYATQIPMDASPLRNGSSTDFLHGSMTPAVAQWVEQVDWCS